MDLDKFLWPEIVPFNSHKMSRRALVLQPVARCRKSTLCTKSSPSSSRGYSPGSSRLGLCAMDESEEPYEVEQPEKSSDEQDDREAAYCLSVSNPRWGDPMTCERCGGLSVSRHFEGGQAWEYDGWECLICGNITDPLIMTNRDAQAHGTRGRPVTSNERRPARGAIRRGRHRKTVRS